MGILGKIKGLFGRKKEDYSLPPEEPLGPPSVTRPEEPIPREEITTPRESLRRESLTAAPSSFEPLRREPEMKEADVRNLRAKLDLLLTEMDSIKTQNQMINERLKAIEKTLAEMRGIRYY